MSSYRDWVTVVGDDLRVRRKRITPAAAERDVARDELRADRVQPAVGAGGGGNGGGGLGGGGVWGAAAGGCKRPLSVGRVGLVVQLGARRGRCGGL